MKKVSNDPHGGPLPGDASYRLHFASAQDFQRAMALAAKLEFKGLHRRAWRVRWNLDGPQPVRMPVVAEMETDCRDGRPAVSLGEVRTMVESLGMTNYAISRELGVAHRTVKAWLNDGRITAENYLKLKEMCK